MFEDAKGRVKSRKSKDRQHNGPQKKTEGQTTQWPTEKGQKNKTLQRKLKI
jgi:hypothetical protein